MLAYLFILIGAILRVIPHPANFAPIAAIALFGGTYLNRKQALALPLLAMLLSDFFIGFDSLQTRLIVYSSFLMIGLIGLWIRKHKTIYTVLGGTLFGSILFFLLTNLPFVHPVSLYPMTLSGTMQSYVNGLPFFKNTLLGDLFYVSVFFGSYELVRFWKNKKLKNYAHTGKSSN
jgi:hypothetical protein